MSLMFPDKCTVTNITRDATHGNETSTTVTTNVRCQIEDHDVTRRDAQGTPMQPIRVILFPKNTTIIAGDDITVTQLHGTTPNAIDAIKREVTMVHAAGGMTVSHLEVETRSERG